MREGVEECEGLLVDVFDILFPIADGAQHHSRVDKVKFLPEYPNILNVINLKLNVWWDPWRLDRAQVGADNINFRVSITQVNGPDAGACWFELKMESTLNRARNDGGVTYQCLCLEPCTSCLSSMVHR